MMGSTHSGNTDSFTPPFDDGVLVSDEHINEDEAIATTTNTDQAASTMATASDGQEEPRMKRALSADHVESFYRSVRRHTTTETKAKEPTKIPVEEEVKPSTVEETAVEEATPTPPSLPLQRPSSPRSDLLEAPTTVPDSEDDGDLVTVASQTIYIPPDQDPSISPIPSPVGDDLSMNADDATVPEEMFREMENSAALKNLARSGSPSETVQDNDTPSNNEGRANNNQAQSGELDSTAFATVGKTLVAPPDVAGATTAAKKKRFQFATAVVLVLLLFSKMAGLDRSRPPQTRVEDSAEIMAEPLKESLDIGDVVVTITVDSVENLLEEEVESTTEMELDSTGYYFTDLHDQADSEAGDEDESTDESFGGDLSEFNESVQTFYHHDEEIHDEGFDIESFEEVEDQEIEILTVVNVSSCEDCADDASSKDFPSPPSNELPEPVTNTTLPLAMAGQEEECQSPFGLLEGNNKSLDLINFLKSLPSFCQQLARLFVVAVFLVIVLAGWLCMGRQDNGKGVGAECAFKGARAPKVEDDMPEMEEEEERASMYPQIDLQNYTHLRCVDLRDELRARSCKVSGLKGELIRRLVDSYQVELDSLPYRELQCRLKQAGLKQTGKKQELILRLLEEGF